MINNCVLKLENGRTISIADDLNSFSVALYPTGERGDLSKFHIFDSGQIDRRCHSMIELVDTIKELSECEIDAQPSMMQKENKKLRHLLFIAHGNEEHYLYGDDGERSCNTCMIDFNTDSTDVIEQKIYTYNMRKIDRLQAEGKWPPKFFNEIVK